MSLISWNNDLEIDVNEMNEQHKVLVNIMNKIYDLHNSNPDAYQIIEKNLHDLIDWTIKHFKEEEEYMATINYPKLEVHKGTHKDLLSVLDTHKLRFERNKKLDDRFFSFLKLWLSSHIMSIDTQYSKFSTN